MTRGSPILGQPPKFTFVLSNAICETINFTRLTIYNIICCSGFLLQFRGAAMCANLDSPCYPNLSVKKPQPKVCGFLRYD
jgi:hypothetical protein